MGNKEYFVVKKHNQYYWSIYNTLEEGYLMIDCNCLLFKNEEEAQKECDRRNNADDN